MTDPIYNAAGEDVTRYAKKLKHLLDLAASAGDTPEGRHAQAKAFEFMEKYGLDAAMLATDANQPRERLVHAQIAITGIYARQLQQLAASIAFAVAGAHPLATPFVKGRKRSYTTYVFGYDSAVLTVKVLYASLLQQVLGEIKTAWVAAVKEQPWLRDYTPMEKFVWKREFISGFATVVGARLAAARAKTVQDSNVPGAAVAIQDRDAVALAFTQQFQAEGVNKQGKLGSHDDSAYFAGRAAGANASIGDSADLSGPRRLAIT